MNIKKYMTIKNILIAGSIIIAFSFITYRSCNLYNRSSVLKGKYDVLVKTTKAEKKLLDKTIKALIAGIKKRDAKIDLAYDSIVKKEDLLLEKNDELSSISLQLEENANLNEGKIATWRERDKLKDAKIAAWKSKFFVSQKMNQDKDKIIFAITEKYESQLIISVSWETAYNDEHIVRLALNKRFKLCERKLRMTRLTKNFGYVAVIIVGGYVIYTNLVNNNN